MENGGMGSWTRRRLLATMAAAGATPRSALAEPRASRKLGYAIVGLGSYATRQIMPHFRLCRFARLTALVSGTPDKLRRFGDEYGVPSTHRYSYADFDRIRDNPDIDIVYVCLPNSMHAEYVIRAAKAGKHVMCEKPMAVSVKECQAMIAACKTAGRKLMIGYRSHFEPHNREGMRLGRSRALGKLRYFRSEHGFTIGDPAQWRLKKALSGGGSLMDIGIYALQASRYMTGEEPLAVTATESTDRSDPRFREVEDQIAFTLEFPSGVIGSCHSMYSANQNHVLLVGDKGRVEMEPATRYDANKMWTGRDGREQQVTPPPGPGKNQFAAQLDHLSECIVTNKEPIVGGEEGLRDLRIMEAIYRSAREGGRRIELAPVRRA